MTGHPHPCAPRRWMHELYAPLPAAAKNFDFKHPQRGNGQIRGQLHAGHKNFLINEMARICEEQRTSVKCAWASGPTTASAITLFILALVTADRAFPRTSKPLSIPQKRLVCAPRSLKPWKKSIKNKSAYGSKGPGLLCRAGRS